MHVDVTRPGQTDTEGLEVPVVYESSPYYSGTASTQSQYFWNVNHELGTAPPPRLSPPPIPHQSRSPIISNSEINTWVPRGFAVVHSESPGTGLSEGCPTVGDANESLAPKAVIDWLNGRAKGYTTREGDVEVEADWSTGKVGMTGTSYNGTLPLAAASTGVDGLEAIIPIAPNTSYYHYYRSNGLVRNPGGWVGEDIDYLFDYINSGYPSNRQYCIDTVRIGEMNAFQDRVTGDYNDFWAGRDYLNAVRGVKAPTLMAHAFNDWNVVPEHSARIHEALKARRIPLQAYYHQGGHGGAPPLVLRNRWFTRYLYGVKNRVERDPRAWVTREAASCPPRTATVVGDQSNTATLTVADASALQLGMTLTVPQTNADGTVTNATRVIDSIPDRDTVVLVSAVATDPGQRVVDGATVSIVCSSANPTPYEDYPNPAASRIRLRPQPGGSDIGGLTSRGRRGRGVETLVDDVGCQAGTLAQAASSPHRLLYATPPLAAPLHVSGTPSVTVRLASSKPAANLSVWLVTLPWTGAAPCTGPATPVANLVTRAWADPQNRGSLTGSRPLAPGRFYDVRFPLQPDDQVIPAGRQLALMIFSSDREFTLRPQPGTELTVDLRGTSLELPVVGGSRAMAESEQGVAR
jgi:predicted acyl esterase